MDIFLQIVSYMQTYPWQIAIGLGLLWAFINRDKAAPAASGLWSLVSKYLPGDKPAPAEDIAANRLEAFEAYLVLHDLLTEHGADLEVIVNLESVLPCVVHIEKKHEVADK